MRLFGADHENTLLARTTGDVTRLDREPLSGHFRGKANAADGNAVAKACGRAPVTSIHR
jgi:hypothetical protein